MRRPFKIKGRKGYFMHFDTEDGKRSVRKIGDSKRQADSFVQSLVDNQKSQEMEANDSPLVLDIMSKYCDYIQERTESGSFAKKSLEWRVKYIASFLRSIDTAMTVDQLKVFHITEWLATEKKWNATTRFHGGATIKRALNWARKQGRIATNPIDLLELEKGGPRDYVIDKDTLSRLLIGASDPKCKRKRVISFRTIMTVLSLSGCRPGEVIKIRVEDCKLDGKMDRWVIRDHKTSRKTNRARIVYLCPCLKTITRIAIGHRKKGPLFYADYGQPWTYSRMRVRFERLRKRLGIDDRCVLYSFRHTSITNALVAGIDVATVAELHGTSIQMIQRHYSHLVHHQKHLAGAALKMGKARRDVG